MIYYIKVRARRRGWVRRMALSHLFSPGCLFILALFHLLALPPLAVSAQVGEYRTDLAVGGSAGYVMSSIGFLPDVPQSLYGGKTAGLTLRYTCERYFKSICALVAEVNYVQAGWKQDILDVNDEPIYFTDDTERSERLRYNRRINYLQVPFMARMGWGRERRGLQAFIQLGMQVGYCLSESTDSNLDPQRSVTGLRSSVVVDQEKMPVENKFDYGIVAGGGLELSLPRVGHVLLEGRYYYGLGNIYGNTKRDYFARSNHGQIVIKASYLFDFIRTRNPKIR